MARLWSSGAELNTITNNVEATIQSSGASVSTTDPASGTYTWRHNVAATFGNIRFDFATTNQTIIYCRFKLKVADAPAALNTFFDAVGTQGQEVGLQLNSDNTLELWNLEDGVQVGSDSSAL